MIDKLKKAIGPELKKICNKVSYQVAVDKTYPHIVFTFRGINLEYLYRYDYILEIGIWSNDPIQADDMMSKAIKTFVFNNLPTDDLLITAYSVDGKTIDDDDKTLYHRVVEVQLQVYEREVT